MKKLLSFLLSSTLVMTAFTGIISQNVSAAGFERQEMYADAIPFEKISRDTVTTGSMTCLYSTETVSKTFEHAIRQDTVDNINTYDEMASVVFDIEGVFLNGAVFTVTPGLLSGDKYKKGDAVFIISVDGNEAARSGVVSYKSEAAELSAVIPAGAKKLTLSVDCWDDTACDWTVWGNPVFKENIPEKDSSAVYLSDLTYTETNKVLNDFGAYQMRVKEDYYLEFENSVFQHASKSGAVQLGYDVSGMTGKVSTFSSYVGLCAYYGSFVGEVNGVVKGSVKFNVYADGELICSTDTLTPANTLTYIEAQLPEGTETLILEVLCADGSNDSDWAMWGDPKIKCESVYLSELTPTQYNPVLYSTGGLPMMKDYGTQETVQYSHGIFWHSASATSPKAALEYDISKYTENGATFTTDIGFLADYNGAALGKDGSFAVNVYIDGALAARSEEVVTLTSPIASLSVAIPAGASKLKLEIDPGKSHSCDWSMFGDPTVTENIYEIAVSESKTLSIGESFDIAVRDIESGKEISDAEISVKSSESSVAELIGGKVTAKASGYALLDIVAEYNGYMMTDSMYVNVRDGIYGGDTLYFLSDMEEESVTSASFNKDAGYKEEKGTGLHFYNGDSFTAFEKGIFTHADSSVVYDVSDIEADALHAYIGIEKHPDFNRESSSSVTFKVYADDDLLYESDEKLITSELEEILVALPEGTEKIKLVCSKGTSNACDHSAWADAALVDLGDALVGGKAYSTVYDAVDSAENGDTVALRSDVTLTSQLTLGDGVTLDIGEYSLDGDGTVYLSANGAKVVSDSEIYGKLTAKTLVGESLENGEYTYVASPYTEAEISFVGAQIRTVGTQGLRFIYEVTGALEDCIFTDYGVVLIPEELGDGASTTESTENIGIVSKRELGDSFNYFENGDNGFSFNVCITGIKPARYGVRFISRGYFRYLSGADEYTVYTPYLDKNDLSILDVAENLAENDEYKELYETILGDYNEAILEG